MQVVNTLEFSTQFTWEIKYKWTKLCTLVIDWQVITMMTWWNNTRVNSLEVKQKQYLEILYYICLCLLMFQLCLMLTPFSLFRGVKINQNAHYPLWCFAVWYNVYLLQFLQIIKSSLHYLWYIEFDRNIRLLVIRFKFDFNFSITSFSFIMLKQWQA